MHLKSLELQGFKSFGRKATVRFDVPVVAVVGPNGSGKSNVAEAFRFALGEQSAKAMRGRRGEDLIWHGSPELPRAGKASVKIVFDNRDRALPLDFDEVSLERVVHRDGVNEYAVNGAPVRLRDTLELLAAANIGPSGHHIVSQGEADRVLAASPKERREILQDALGLRALEWKRAEALRKLGKTDENAGQVRALLAELEPRLRFLRRQVEKVERAERLRAELLERYRAYLALESARVRAARVEAIEALRAPNDEKERLAAQILEEERRAARVEAPAVPAGLAEAEAALAAARDRARRLGREIGAAEGELAALERLAAPTVRASLPSDERPIPRSLVREAIGVARDCLRRAEAAETYAVAGEALREAVRAVEALVAAPGAPEPEAAPGPDFTARTAELLAKLGELRLVLEAADEDERRAAGAAEELRAARDAARVDVAEAERALVGLVSRKGALEREIDRLALEARLADTDEETLRAEMQEAVALVGREALDFEGTMPAPAEHEPREVAQARRRELERLKLRLEEAGAAGGEEVMKEYREATSRDEFLRQEIGDLDASAATLRALIGDLERKVAERFNDGLAKINVAFGELFAAMFGGGHAALKVTKIEKRRRADDEVGLPEVGLHQAEEAEDGVEVSVELPKKRVAGLFQLSGGERSLVSIALLFAMSRVAPPPFVILDETDAALDEANSRRYGDMIEKLAEKSQLVLITHNRETMSRAGALYGVTAGAVGSTLLSVKFDDAAAMAAR